ncbi:MAG: TerB family tellurite resistance protein [Kiloniellales bacterium]|nr:TerB family tellurite resistance protein [Kiloniellales bacterium]
MSVWGKILGGAAGFAIGGPLGALLGGLAGHAVDKMRQSTEDGAEAADATKNVAFTIGVIVLGAKMAKADGVVTRDEIGAFKEVFRIPPREMKNVGRLFDQARRDSRGFEPYARQLGRMFRQNPAVLEELLEGLFHIAKADGQVTEAELEYLASVAKIFGLDPERWERVKAANVAAGDADPYGVLGVRRDVSDDDLKGAYRRLVRENHPDKLVAQGMPQEFVDLANEKLAQINAAYDTVRKHRGLD